MDYEPSIDDAAFDHAVRKAIEGDPDMNTDSYSTNDLVGLLITIVGHSQGVLDDKYELFAEAKAIIKVHEELRGELVKAWNNKKYGEVRRLDVLQSTKVTAKGPHFIETQLYESLWQSFQLEYLGIASEGLCEYLIENEQKFRKTCTPATYYARFCSIVQSSGTGKSRMLTELVKDGVVVIYMNLREETDRSSFPVRDNVPSEILTRFSEPAASIYQVTCYTFFIALFDALLDTLSEISEKADLTKWAWEMVDMGGQYKTRANFYDRVSKKYGEISRRARRGHRTASDVSMASSADQTADAPGNLLPSATSSRKQDISDQLYKSYSNMAGRIEKILGGNPNRPKLVIAFDEAHPLTLTRGNKNDPYRPADVLCRAINRYSHGGSEQHAIWVVFASTASNISDFSLPSHKYNSDRVAQHGEKLFPPYTQLGWDQCAGALLSNADMKNVSKARHIVGFGRPLWSSYRDVDAHPDITLELALYKLCGTDKFKPRKSNHVLAVLGQRFGLNVVFGHPDSVEHLETGIASHLRICLGTTPDRIWRFTDYPSEPFLSCAAARALHSESSLGPALNTLLHEVDRGMIEMGQRGELASRLLWLLAKDIFVRTKGRDLVNGAPSTWDDHLADCQMIPVVDWLEFVFGKGVWPTDQPNVARDAFKNAYINFSHWVCMDVNIAGSRKRKEISLDEWTERHWQRTSAVQCCHQQPMIDKVVPIYFQDESSQVSRMSQIFISDKARSRSSKRALNYIDREDASIVGFSSTNGSPYIAILADLGVKKPQVTATYTPSSGDSDFVLRIYAAGVDTKTYAFLKDYPSLQSMLQDLVRLQSNPEQTTMYRKDLDDQVKFGRTPTEDHMSWQCSVSGAGSEGESDSGVDDDDEK